MKISTAVKRQLAAAAVIGLAATTAEAVVIDNFNVTQPALTVNQGTTTAGSQAVGANTDILGGERDMFLQLLSVTTPGNGSVAEVQGANSLLDFSQQATSRALLTLTYDGSDPGADLTGPIGAGPNPGALAFNLGSQNFTLGGDQAILLSIGSSEAGAQFVFTIYSGGGATSSTATFDVVSAINAPQTFAIPYATFVGSGTFTDVDAFTIEISGPPSLDVTLDAVQTGIPEPSTALAALGIFGAIGTTLRRRTRQAAATA